MTKSLSLLLYPLTQCLLLGLFALLALLFDRRRLAMGLLLPGITWLYLCSTSLFADYLMATLEDDYPPRALSATEQAGAIVLLGGAMRGDTHMGSRADLNQQADRLVHAVALYKAGKAPLLLLTGGGPPGVRTEAEQMRDLLEIMGVPPGAMLLEEASRDTYQNALYSAAMLRQRGIDKVLLVTSAFHMRRATQLFAFQGLEVIPAPTDYQRLAGSPVLPSFVPLAGNLVRSTYSLHEHLGYWVYRYRGWL